MMSVSIAKDLGTHLKTKHSTSVHIKHNHNEQRERERDRQTDRQTDRQRQRETERERQTDRQRVFLSRMRVYNYTPVTSL